MSRAFSILDAFLRGRAWFHPTRPLARPSWWLPAIILIASPLYGLVMGSFSLNAWNRAPLSIYSAIKMPLLLLATMVTCLPGFFALNTVLKLRDDFGQALQAIFAAQAALSISLLSLGPLTAVWYLSDISYRAAILFNGLMFALATAAGQWVMVRYYRPLIRRNRAHLWALSFWIVSYAFVGIQMGWMLRPFIGSPTDAAEFFRDEPFTNAYIVVGRLLTGN